MDRIRALEAALRKAALVTEAADKLADAADAVGPSTSIHDHSWVDLSNTVAAYREARS
jgi:hypothetical protein